MKIFSIKLNKFFQVLELPFLLVLTSSLTLGPVIVSYFRIGESSAFNFLAADSMYYALVANNFVKFGFPTADGVHITNGFQPLWELVISLVFMLWNVSHDYQLFVLFGLSVIGVLVGYLFIAIGLKYLLGFKSAVVGILFLYPGFYDLFFSPRVENLNKADPGLMYTLSPWSAMNGVETPALVFLWGCLFLVLSIHYHRKLLPLTRDSKLTLSQLFNKSSVVLMSLIFMCRLEQGLIFLAIGIVALLLPYVTFWDLIKDALKVFYPVFIISLIYFSYNLLFVGTLLPSSGMSKLDFGFGYLKPNLNFLFNTIAGNNPVDWWGISSRIYPLLFGLISSVLLIFLSIRAWRPSTQNCSPSKSAVIVYCAMTALFILLNSSFLFLFEHLISIGYWYFFSITTLTSIIFSITLGYVANTRRVSNLFFIFGVVILIFRMPNQAAQVSHLPASYADTAKILWEKKDLIRAEILTKYPEYFLVDTWDGMFGFMLDLPIKSYTGLVASPSEVKRNKEVGFWRSATEDGTRLIVPSFRYFSFKENLGPNFQIEEANVISAPMKFFIVKEK